MAEMKIEIAVIVGDNGNFSATRFLGDETDWGFLSETTGVYDSKKKKVIYQGAEKRYIVTAFVEVPATDLVDAHQVDAY